MTMLMNHTVNNAANSAVNNPVTCSRTESQPHLPSRHEPHRPAAMRISDGLQLEAGQAIWLQDWLTRFGTWVYSGRLSKRQTSMIAEFMATVENRGYAERPACSDEEGMLIHGIVDRLYHTDRDAFRMLLARYVFCASDREIARQHQNASAPRIMARRGGMARARKPSLSTCRREVAQILGAAEYMLYQPLRDAFRDRDGQIISKRNEKRLLTSLNQ